MSSPSSAFFWVISFLILKGDRGNMLIWQSGPLQRSD